MRSGPRTAWATGESPGWLSEKGESGIGNGRSFEAPAVPDSPFTIPGEQKRAKPGRFHAQAWLEFRAWRTLKFGSIKLSDRPSPMTWGRHGAFSSVIRDRRNRSRIAQ